MKRGKNIFVYPLISRMTFGLAWWRLRCLQRGTGKRNYAYFVFLKSWPNYSYFNSYNVEALFYTIYQELYKSFLIMSSSVNDKTIDSLNVYSIDVFPFRILIINLQIKKIWCENLLLRSFDRLLFVYSSVRLDFFSFSYFRYSNVGINSIICSRHG